MYVYTYVYIQALSKYAICKSAASAGSSLSVQFSAVVLTVAAVVWAAAM
jgi:hypothetical protein